MKKLILILIILLGLAVVVALSVKPRPSAATVPAVGDCGADTFLCDSLTVMTKMDAGNAYTSGAETSFDGTTHMVRTWKRDAVGDFTLQTVKDGVVTDSVVHKNKKHMTKNNKKNVWESQTVASPDGMIADQAMISEIIGFDEMLGIFFDNNPLRANLFFEKIGEEPCGTMTCVKYLALDKKTPTAEKKRYLYFDLVTHRLIKYQDIDPAFQTELLIDYTPVTTLDTTVQ